MLCLLPVVPLIRSVTLGCSLHALQWLSSAKAEPQFTSHHLDGYYSLRPWPACDLADFHKLWLNHQLQQIHFWTEGETSYCRHLVAGWSVVQRCQVLMQEKAPTTHFITVTMIFKSNVASELNHFVYTRDINVSFLTKLVPQQINTD